MKKATRSIRNKSEFMIILNTFGIYEMPERRSIDYFNGCFWAEPHSWEEFLKEVSRAKANLVVIENLQEEIKEMERMKELELFYKRRKYESCLRYSSSPIYKRMAELYREEYALDAEAWEQEIKRSEDKLNYHMVQYYDVVWDLYYCFMEDKNNTNFLISDEEDRQNYTFRGKSSMI